MGWLQSLFRNRNLGTNIPNQPRSAFRTLGRRRYMQGVPYVLPTDMSEVNRLDFQHYMLRYTMKGNYAAPLRQPHDILDVGCGTGRWAMEIAHDFPQANVIGTDIVEPQAESAASLGHGLDQRPENYLFMQGNILEHLPFPDASFDYVHMRFLFLAIPVQQWPAVVQELARVTRHGGWIEIAETVFLGPEERFSASSNTFLQWLNLLVSKRGIDTQAGSHIEQYMQTAGLQRIVSKEFPLPLGSSNGRVGQLVETDFFALIDSLKPVILQVGLATPEEFHRIETDVRHDIMTRTDIIQPFYVAFGQKA